MLRAIREAGYQPLCFRKPNIAGAILPYVESGIPVILGLHLTGNVEVGHAVTVIGRIFARQSTPTPMAINYVPAYIVHDDQGGPYMTLPVKDPAGMPHPFADDTVKRGTIELNMSHATFAVALMSTRVFSTAAAAEMSVRDRLDETLGNVRALRHKLAKEGHTANDRLLNELEAAYAAGHVVLRTYLTSAAGYRRHIADGTASDELKDALLELHLPHFTWVTEISTIDSYNNASAGMRRMYGHAIIDATSTGKGRDATLMLHLPGLIFTNDVNAPRDKDPETSFVIDNDDLYNCREKRLD